MKMNHSLAFFSFSWPCYLIVLWYFQAILLYSQCSTLLPVIFLYVFLILTKKKIIIISFLKRFFNLHKLPMAFFIKAQQRKAKSKQKKKKMLPRNWPVTSSVILSMKSKDKITQNTEPNTASFQTLFTNHSCQNYIHF